VSFYDFTVTAADVQQLYNSQQQQSTATATYLFLGNADDSTGTNHGVVNGATLTADRFGSPNGAYAFDGTADVRILLLSYTSVM
jgi:hypothetical protein